MDSFGNTIGGKLTASWREHFEELDSELRKMILQTIMCCRAHYARQYKKFYADQRKMK